MLLNVTVAPPSSSAPKLLPLGLFSTPVTNLSMMDVRFSVAPEMFQQYLEFFSKNLLAVRTKNDGGVGMHTVGAVPLVRALGGPGYAGHLRHRQAALKGFHFLDIRTSSQHTCSSQHGMLMCRHACRSGHPIRRPYSSRKIQAQAQQVVHGQVLGVVSCQQCAHAHAMHSTVCIWPAQVLRAGLVGMKQRQWGEPSQIWGSSASVFGFTHVCAQETCGKAVHSDS
jgi:hypothetical protein